MLRYNRNMLAGLVASIGLLPLQVAAQAVDSNQDNSAEEKALVSTETTEPKEDQDNVEHIEVIGRYIGIEAPEAFGRFMLSKDFIRNAPKTTGDINDLIALLPGVQLSEDALAVSQAGEIRAKQISISGAQPWQTGFFINGMNFNSRLDPGAYNRSEGAVNDVQGGPQNFNVNSQIVDSIDVYDSNIPVEFGGFSGGVVDVQTASAVQADKARVSLGYRGSNSDWNQYHIINGDIDDDGDVFSTDLLTPEFEQQSVNFLASTPLSENQGLLVSVNYLTAKKSKVSFREIVNTERQNINLLVKYSLRNAFFDNLDWSVLYAPYENRNLQENVLNSELVISGGGYGTTLNAEKAFSSGEWISEFSFNTSENSREAPPHFYLWLQANGKAWGRDTAVDDDLDDTQQPVSREGGFGDLDKTQTTVTWRNQFQFNDWQWGRAEHRLKVGLSAQYQALGRKRNADSYYYNSAVQYSASAGNNALNCSGYTLDCVELSLAKSIEALEAELGEPLDFSNPEHILLYSDNVLVSPQFFNFRIVYPTENIRVNVNQIGVYLNDQIHWDRLTLNAGLRYEYDDFFKNHTLAPRFSGSWDWFDDNSTLLVFGASRYYDAGLATYKLKQESKPYYTEFRPILNGSLQAWGPSSLDADLRYRYEGLDSPYNDEVVLALKQSLGAFGFVSLRGIHRWQRDQLARASESELGADGYRYAYQDNSGFGTSSRISLAWSASWRAHSFWANTDFSHTKSNGDSYNEAVDDVSLDELVWYIGNGVGSLTTQSAVATLNTNFSRPLRVNFGWHADWTETFSTTLNGAFTDAYHTAVATGQYISSGNIAWLCNDCDVDSISVPIYRKVEFARRWQVNLATRYTLSLHEWGNLTLSVDITNLFNTRTFMVTPGNDGVETGRTLWAGARWDW